MNINDIINNTIAGLICALICTLFNFLFKFIKKLHSRNSELFLLYTRLVAAILGILSSFWLIFTNNDIYPLWLYASMFIINLGGILLTFNDAIEYGKNTGCNSDKN